jgi:hypothetical protein
VGEGGGGGGGGGAGGLHAQGLGQGGRIENLSPSID